MSYSRMGRIQARVTTFGVVAAQVVAGGAFAGLLAATGEAPAAYSVLVGTLAGTAPGFFFALRLANIPPDASPRARLRSIYIGETVKIVFAVAVLASAIAVLDVRFGYLLGGYLITVLVGWLALAAPLPGEFPGNSGQAERAPRR